MKLVNYVVNAGVVLIIGAAAPLAWSQATEPSFQNGSTAVPPAATSPIVPAEKIAPGVPGIPSTDKSIAANSGYAPTDAASAGYVDQKISEAQHGQGCEGGSGTGSHGKSGTI